jgi:hypothetical protein
MEPIHTKRGIQNQSSSQDSLDTKWKERQYMPHEVIVLE